MRRCLLVILISFVTIPVIAQRFSYSLKDGRMIVSLNKMISEEELDHFISQFDLGDMDLKKILKSNNTDSLTKLGWKIEQNTKQLLTVSKPLIPIEDLSGIGEKIAFIGKHAPFDDLFPSAQYETRLGYNQFSNKQPFKYEDSVLTFFLRGHKSARKVMLAGDFNAWSPDNLPMIKTDSGWIARVKLPQGKTWYKFIVDGNWITDDDNLINEHDGRGNNNSVFYVTNHVFRLNGHTNAKRVNLAGSFNDWDPKGFPMKRLADGWELPVFLAQGTHTYKFVVDGRWVADPVNNEVLPDGVGAVNSVVRLGKPYVFNLKGFTDAGQVWLMGSFNGWKHDELQMKKTADGWQLPYTLGDGNYEYKFIVDGKPLRDPSNNIDNNGNSFLTINPNHTFRLKGMGRASSVYLAGDFNNWAPNSLVMKRDGEDWVFSVHLSKGKHLYKYIVDGKWIIDPENKLWEENEYGTGNSIIWKE